MTTIIGLSGSLRRRSYNTALLNAAAALTPADVVLTVRTIHGIPIYNGDDEESSGIPQLVQALKDEIAAADGLLLCTPEYNHSIPGALKNAVDWLSRPDEDSLRVFGEKPVALMGATPGGFGTVLSQNAWLPILGKLGMKPWFGGQLLVSRAFETFGATGRIIDPELEKQVRDFVSGFAHFAAEAKRPLSV